VNSNIIIQYLVELKFTLDFDDQQGLR